MTETTTPAPAKRLCAGHYLTLDGRYEIHHIEMADEGDGYGRIDHWVVVETADNFAWDPSPTLYDARMDIAEANQ